MSEWISVAEGKPSGGVRVLLKIKYEEFPVVGFLWASEWEVCTENTTVQCGTWCQGGMVEKGFESSEVTHWMPLRDLPK